LGTTTGWAGNSGDSINHIYYGKIDLKPSRHEDAGMRWVKLRMSLLRLTKGPSPFDLIVYEEIAAHKGTAAAHIYGGLVAHVQLWCKENDIRYTGVPVGTIKKHATGKGNAGKMQMVKAANDKFDFVVEPLGEKDHDIADALHLLDYAMHEYKE